MTNNFRIHEAPFYRAICQKYCVLQNVITLLWYINILIRNSHVVVFVFRMHLT